MTVLTVLTYNHKIWQDANVLCALGIFISTSRKVDKTRKKRQLYPEEWRVMKKNLFVIKKAVMLLFQITEN